MYNYVFFNVKHINGLQIKNLKIHKEKKEKIIK